MNSQPKQTEFPVVFVSTYVLIELCRLYGRIQELDFHKYCDEHVKQYSELVDEITFDLIPLYNPRTHGSFDDFSNNWVSHACLSPAITIKVLYPSVLRGYLERMQTCAKAFGYQCL
jgi:hypothetical protein